MGRDLATHHMLKPWDDPTADVHALWKWIGRNGRLPTWLDTIDEEQLQFKSQWLCVEKGSNRVYWSNGSYIGDVVQLEDGFWCFFIKSGKSGGWEAHVLRAIGDALDALNKDWAKTVEEGLRDGNS